MRHGYGGRESVEAPCRQANEKYRKNRRKILDFFNSYINIIATRIEGSRNAGAGSSAEAAPADAP